MTSQVPQTETNDPLLAYDVDTLTFYNANAKSYSLARPAEVSPDLLAFLSRLDPGCRILEIGCGSGCDAEAMENAGFDVDATDGSHEMAALATKRLTKPARTLRFDQIEAIEEYDAVVACASLLHVPHSGLLDALQRVWTALRQGGWHFASYKTGSEHGHDNHRRYYNQLAHIDAEQFYRDAGLWSAIEFDEYEGVGYFSAPSRWLTVTACK